MSFNMSSDEEFYDAEEQTPNRTRRYEVNTSLENSVKLFSHHFPTINIFYSTCSNKMKQFMEIDSDTDRSVVSDVTVVPIESMAKFSRAVECMGCLLHV